eukprot:TRINITY_DN13121_c0_g1_i2.p1 TRINITY_DN13121_c0_g1~~TRINITY_DN13121_c0_g1_i2.p1  ORF type:complete len:595 (-),score=81.91 TRINITY_DN13121_c0_g1_i2:8-1792(-)
MLRPRKLPKTDFLYCYVSRDTTKVGLNSYRKFYTTLQPFRFSIDQSLYIYLMGYWSWLNRIIMRKKLSIKEQNILKYRGEIPRLTEISSKLILMSSVIYFQKFYISSLKFNFDYYGNGIPKDAFLRSVDISYGLSLTDMIPGNIKGAEVTLNRLQLQHSFCSEDQFFKQLKSYYTRTLITQALLNLGASDILNVVGTTVDFFSSIFSQSIKEEGAPVEDADRKSTAAFFGTASKISNTISRGMESFVEEDYVENRIKKKIQPRNAEEGFALGMQNFQTGILEGATGFLAHPTKGLQREGTLGALKGLSLGFSGLLTKPALGFVDLISNTTEGIANQISENDLIKTKRKRVPRYFDESGRIFEYQTIQEKSIGQNLLYLVDYGIYRSQHYFYHQRINPTALLFITTKAVLGVCLGEIGGIWHTNFCTMYISGVNILPKKMTVTIEFYDKHFEFMRRDLQCHNHTVAAEIYTRVLEFKHGRPFYKINEGGWINRESLKAKLSCQGPIKARTEAGNRLFDDIYVDCRLSVQSKHLHLSGLLSICCNLTQVTVYKSTNSRQWIIIERGHKPLFFKCDTIKEVQQWIDTCVLNGALFRG